MITTSPSAAALRPRLDHDVTSSSERESEGAADADLAVQPHPSAEQLHDPTRQREPESRSLLTGGSPPALLERLEDALEVLVATPTPVSVTVIARSGPSFFARMVTVPPSPVNFTALLTD